VIRVGVIGALGRMGQMVCRAVSDDPGLTLVAAVDRAGRGERIGRLIGHPESEIIVSDLMDTLLQEEVEVAVDFTHPDVVHENVQWCVQHAIHDVVGTTGLTNEELAEIDAALASEGGESNVLVAPNFALGAVLMEQFAAIAARVFPAVEIIELHHDDKADAPSGTALSTARRLEAARAEVYKGPDDERVTGARGGDVEGIRIHSVRLPGLVAHQEVIFGGQGQTLTVRHDVTDRSSFMPGVLLAIRSISTRPGLTIGLEALLDRPGPDGA